jgi:hypothetical protein
MGSKNNQTAALMESDQGNTDADIELKKMPEKEPEKEGEVETSLVKMDINRYLGKSTISKSRANLLRVIFKGQMATEAEWDAKTKEALNRRAK